MKRSINLLIIVVLAVNLFSGCKGCNSKNADCSSDITFQLNWTNDPTFTGEYLAYEKFWFIDKLKVTIKQGGIGVDPIATIVAKQSDYAVVGADKALMAIADGKPIKIISVDLQRNPVGWIARPSLKVNNFNDLNNRKDIIIGDKAGTEVSSILSLIIRRKNLSINPQPVSFDFSYFIANENCVYPVYLNEEPVRARILNDIDIVEIDPLKDENGGIKLYGNVIICHQDKLDSCKEQVDKVIEGLSKGWTYAQQNEDESAQIVNKYVKNDIAYVKEVIKRTVSFATNLYGNKVPSGHMDIGAWQNTYNTLKEADLLSKDFDLRTAIYIK
jgi:NitT/TauT family transport system substrate-binding protein